MLALLDYFYYRSNGKSGRSNFLIPDEVSTFRAKNMPASAQERTSGQTGEENDG